MIINRAIKRSIKIEASSNDGFIVNVGCGTFVFKDRRDLINALEEYLVDPEKYEKAYAELSGGEWIRTSRDEAVYRNREQHPGFGLAGVVHEGPPPQEETGVRWVISNSERPEPTTPPRVLNSN